MLQKLYDRCLDLARHKLSKPLLAFISFIESSFFPIPPDVMIVPMVLAKKENYFQIFLIATIFSVLGGILGYFLGSLFLDFSMSIIEFYNYENKVFELQEKLSNKTGLVFWIGTLFLAGFTPLPYKVFTITSGFIGFNLYIFIVISLISRGLRFFIVSYFSMKFGEKFEFFLKKAGFLWFTVIGILIVLALLGMYFYFK
jgi:membrane protein YqaA with SNARE-associated domain